VAEAPVPPNELVQRVARIEDPDVDGTYLQQGRATLERLERLLPEGWSWDGKRVLDFGCGAGRTLRHLAPRAPQAELHGCDVDGPSIGWLAEQLSPPLHVLQNGERPPLRYQGDTFDLVYALSVFTHITDLWAEWLLELRRILRPGGVLVATFMNAESWVSFGFGPWDEERTGMLVTRTWNPPDLGGPFVYHSEWWLREHWGRAFEVVFLERRPPVSGPGQTAGAIVLRPRPGDLEPADLERAGDPLRELEALSRNLELLHAEAAELYSRAP
jgi:SAM-dependent methyltransferase